MIAIDRALGIAVLVGLLAAPPAPGRADPFLDRLALGAARQQQLRAECGEDRLCIARRLATAQPDRYRLVAVPTPDTDTIRWVRNRPSIVELEPLEDGRLLVRLERLGRNLLREFREKLPAGARILLDLRGHDGGDFGRMLQLARALLGPRLTPPLLDAGDGPRPVALPVTPSLGLTLEGVLVGPGTASSAEVLAALAAHAGVPLCGSRSRGKDWLEVVVPARQGWQLYVRRGRIIVPGVRLAGGLRPHRDIAACLAASGR